MENPENIPNAKPDQDDPIEPTAGDMRDAASADDQVKPNPASENSMPDDQQESEELVENASLLDAPITAEDFEKWWGGVVAPTDPNLEKDEDQ